jgi:hypothetical protein
LLGFGGAALGFAGALLGLGDAVADLLQAPLALVLLRLELGQALGLGGAALGFPGALFDLAQPVLRFAHRPLLRFTLLLQVVFGSLQVGGGRGGRRWNRAHALRHLRGAGRPRVGLALHPFGLGDPPVGLRPDPRLLDLDLLDLGLHPRFGGCRVVVTRGRSG